MSGLESLRDFRAGVAEPDETARAAAHARLDATIAHRRPLLRRRPVQIAVAFAVTLVVAAPALGVGGWLLGRRDAGSTSCWVTLALRRDSPKAVTNTAAAARREPGVAGATFVRRLQIELQVPGRPVQLPRTGRTAAAGGRVLTVALEPDAPTRVTAERLAALPAVEFAFYGCRSRTLGFTRRTR